MHSCIFLSTADVSLYGLHISLEIVSESLLGVGWWGGFSSHSVYTRLIARLSSDHWVCLFLQGEFTTPWTWVSNILKFWRKLENSTLLSWVLLFGLLCRKVFRRRLQSCQQNISPANFCASCWYFSFCSIFLAVSSLVVRLKSMSELDSLLRGQLHYWWSLWWLNVSDIFGLNCFLTATAYWEVCYLTSFLLVSWQRRFRRVASMWY